MMKRSVVCTLGVALALLAPASRAQAPAAKPESAENEALTDKARQLYQEGLTAILQSRWADAHASFLAAWKIKPQYQFASNLGTAEFKLGKYRDAAEHLTLYVREAPAIKEKERVRVDAMLKEALAQVAAVTVQVVPEGVEVTVDGAIVGKAPLAQPVFLEPGDHEIGAQLVGYAPAKQAVTAKAGATETVSLALRIAPPAPPASAGALAPVKGAGEPPRPERRWSTRTVVIGGAAAAGAAAVAGVVFTVVANAKASDAEAQRDALARGDSAPCSSGGGSPACMALDRAIDGRDTFSNLAVWSFVSAGALGAGTAIYALTRSAATPETRMQIRPLVGPTVAGLSLGGAL